MTTPMPQPMKSSSNQCGRQPPRRSGADRAKRMDRINLGILEKHNNTMPRVPSSIELPAPETTPSKSPQDPSTGLVAGGMGSFFGGFQRRRSSQMTEGSWGFGKSWTMGGTVGGNTALTSSMTMTAPESSPECGAVDCHGGERNGSRGDDDIRRCSYVSEISFDEALLFPEEIHDQQDLTSSPLGKYEDNIGRQIFEHQDHDTHSNGGKRKGDGGNLNDSNTSLDLDDLAVDDDSLSLIIDLKLQLANEQASKDELFMQLKKIQFERDELEKELIASKLQDLEQLHPEWQQGQPSSREGSCEENNESMSGYLNTFHSSNGTDFCVCGSATSGATKNVPRRMGRPGSISSTNSDCKYNQSVASKSSQASEITKQLEEDNAHLVSENARLQEEIQHLKTSFKKYLKSNIGAATETSDHTAKILFQDTACSSTSGSDSMSARKNDSLPTVASPVKKTRTIESCLRKVDRNRYSSSMKVQRSPPMYPVSANEISQANTVQLVTANTQTNDSPNATTRRRNTHNANSRSMPNQMNRISRSLTQMSDSDALSASFCNIANDGSIREEEFHEILQEFDHNELFELHRRQMNKNSRTEDGECVTFEDTPGNANRNRSIFSNIVV